MARRNLVAGGLALGIALMGLVGLTPGAEAAIINGRLINRTPKGKGVEGAEVTLTLYRND